MEKIVEVKKLYFKYDESPLLEDVNFSINRGDFVGIVGANGSAKSTLIKLVLGILKPKRGEVCLMGQPIDKFKEWYKIGYISQNVRNFNNSFPATVEEIIAVNLYHEMGILKFIRKKHEEKINEVLELVDMIDYKKQLIGKLSGGQQQRIFIARTLISNPEIIFMDEPLVGVDVDSQQRFLSLMGKLNKDLGITLIIVSHDLEGIIGYTNKIACIREKRVFIHDSKHFNEKTDIKRYDPERKELLHPRDL